MKITFLKIIKDALKELLSINFSLGFLILSMIVVLPALYFLDTYIFPDFSSKVDNRIVGKVFILSFIVFSLLYILAYYFLNKNKIAGEIKKDINEPEKEQEEEYELNLAQHSNKIITGIFKFLILPIVIGITIQSFGQKFNSIKDENINLFDIDRNYSNSIPNISVSPIEIKLSWLKRTKLRLGVYNSSKKTLKNGILHIDLPEGCRVIGGETWIPTANSSVYTNLININPNTRLILLPLELEFLEPKTYEAEYSISGEDFRFSQKRMLIKIIQ